MPDPFPLNIEVGGIGAIHVMHDLAEICGRGFQNEVIMLCEALDYVKLRFPLL